MAQENIQLLRPTGVYNVGVSVHFLKDIFRYYNDKTSRPLLIRIYYPAVETHTNYPPYLSDTMHLYKEKILHTLKVSLKDLEYLDAINDWAIPDAPIDAKNQPFPVLFFSPGFLMASQLYSSLIEEMASYGYVVVTINHTGACWPVMFPDGSSPELLPEFVNIFSNPERSCMETFDRAQETWIQDVEFVLSWLQDQPFKNIFDFSRVGIFGHSFGGSTATEAVRRFHIFKAMANLDGMLFGPSWDQPFEIPSLFIVAEKQLTHEDALNLGITVEQCDSLLARSSKKLYDQCKNNAFYVTIRNADHASFVDSKLIKSPLSRIRSNPVRVIELTRSLLVDFFDHYLKNKDIVLLGTQEPLCAEMSVEKK